MQCFIQIAGCRCLDFALEVLGEEQEALWHASPDWNPHHLVQGFDASAVLALLVEKDHWNAAIR